MLSSVAVSRFSAAVVAAAAAAGEAEVERRMRRYTVGSTSLLLEVVSRHRLDDARHDILFVNVQ